MQRHIAVLEIALRSAVLVGSVALTGCQAERCCLIGHYAQSASTVADVTPIDSSAGEQVSTGQEAVPGDSRNNGGLREPLPLPAADTSATEASNWKIPLSTQFAGAHSQSQETASQIGSSQIGSSQIGSSQIGNSQIGNSQIGNSQIETVSLNQQEIDSSSVASVQPRRFEVPRELPGSDASSLRLPAFDENQPLTERRSLIRSLFPELPHNLIEQTEIDRADRPMTLAELQQHGLANSPVLSQAAADVELARGKTVQVGLYPNPTIGYQGDTIGTGGTAGYNGAFLSQELITGGKLTLAQDSALMAMQAAEANLRKSRIALASDIRRGYFKVLLAQESVTFSRALAQLSEEVYQAQIDLVAGGENAPYEPLQLRVLAVQARNAVVRAENQATAAWRQLASTLGVPDMPRNAVAGSVEVSAPKIDFQSARDLMLSIHSDLVAANAMISSEQFNLQLQEAIPVPNIELYTALQHDDTSAVNDLSFNLQIGIPVPIYDRNEGNITSAHAKVTRAQQDLIDKRNSLQSTLAEIYCRYSSNVTIASSYRTEILQDQVRVYRGVYDRFREAGDSVDFAQVVVAQQTLSQAVVSYLDVLGEQWDATIDLAEILQVDDLFTMGVGAEVVAVP